MKTIIFHSILLFTFVNVINAQCPPGNIVLNSQAELDDFVMNYPLCDSILGDFRLNNEDITNASNLNIKHIEGELLITNTGLTNLEGFENLKTAESILLNECSQINSLSALSSLETIGDYIAIDDCDELSDLDGLGNLSSPFIDFAILDNDNLISLNGLNINLTSLQELYIGNNPNLTNLEGLENIQQIGSGIQISNCENIVNLEGLGNLTLFSGYVQIFTCQSLNSLSGLEGLTSVSSINISECPSLLDLKGLENIVDITSNGGGSITLYDNDGLLNLDGLNPSLTIAGGIYIRKNDLLNICAIAPICNALSNGNTANISENGAGCESKEIVEDICLGVVCPTGNVALSTQSQVDAFITNYPDCDTIFGTLTIGDTSQVSSDIHDLTGLNSLVHITDSLFILNNDSLLTLSGLNNLNSIGQTLSVYSNDALIDLTGLDNIDSIGGILGITNNLSLLNLEGLSNGLKQVESFIVLNNPSLISLQGIEGLELIEQSLVLNQNKELVDANGLENLISIGSRLRVTNNEKLENLLLENLKDLNQLIIEDNELLSEINLSNIDTLTIFRIEDTKVINLNGFSGLEYFKSPFFITITLNSELIDITGLENAIFSTDANIIFHLSSNFKLSSCSIESICNYLSDGGDIAVFDNETGCDSQSEIEAGCMTSINNGISDTHLNIYPVPVESLLNIETHNGDVIQNIQLFNSMGKQVYFNSETLGIIDLSEFSSGLYILTCLVNGEKLRSMIIVH